MNDKVNSILASLQCMPYPFSKLKEPIYLASLHCFQQRWDSVRKRKKKSEHLTKRTTKPFSRIALLLLLIWFRCLLSVLSNSLFISTHIQFTDPLLFIENCNLGKYHMRSFCQFFMPKRENNLSLDNFILRSFASLVFWTHYKVVAFRYVPRTQLIIFLKTWLYRYSLSCVVSPGGSPSET